MKKTISLIVISAFIISLFSFSVSAASCSYEQPFEAGTAESDCFRIPSLITLNNGSVMAAADMRYSHGSDSPNNIDTLVAISKDGVKEWEHTVVNCFDDYSASANDSGSASFIDSALVQSKKTNRIFIITDAFPSGVGYNQSKKGTGCITDKNGKQRIALTASDKAKSINDYECYIDNFIDGFAKIAGSNNRYSVDEEFNIYCDGKPLYTKQKASGIEVRQNIFYSSSVYHVYPTSYLCLRYSDNNGLSWSTPKILNSQVKTDDEAFLGICPGKGLTVNIDNDERIIFTTYNNKNLTENTKTIYSDDNGVTWNSGKNIKFRLGLQKSSEAQIVTCDDNTLLMFARNASDYVSTAKSVDGGITWSRMKAEESLKGKADCMVSAVNYKSGSKNYILVSFPSSAFSRADGVIKVGVLTNNKLSVISTYHVNKGFFAYSCLTVLQNGNIGFLYEDEAAHIKYSILSLSDDGILSEIEGKNIAYNQDLSDKEKILGIIKNVYYKFAFCLKLL